MFRRFFRLVFIVSLVVGLVATVGAAVAGFYFYFRLTRDLPQIASLNDYRPKAVTTIYAKDGSPIAEIFDERRYPVPLDKIPKTLRNAFLAAEDANFYSHPGIDIVSIVRAMWVNFRRGATRQGASTITQQIVKSLLLSKEKTMERKAKEAVLSYRLEKALSKDEILTIYLNEIFLGNGAYGVRAASKVHFHKELDQLTVAESAFLAGLPQKPSELIRIENRAMALRRQRYVLDQMLEKKLISKAEFDEARKQELIIHAPEEHTILAAPFYSGHLIKYLDGLFPTIDQYLTPRNPGGFSVYTSVDLKATALAERSLHRGVREVDKRQGWRGPKRKLAQAEIKPFLAAQKIAAPSDLQPDELYDAVVAKINADGTASVLIGELTASVPLKDAGWAKRLVKDGHAIGIELGRQLKPGDVIEVSLIDESDEEKKKGEEKGEGKGKAGDKRAGEDAQPGLKLKLDQTPELEGAFMIANAQTGEVVAMVGGYDYRRSQFNRVTQAERQPGSAFKPFVYLAALEHLNYTPATIVPDSPISLVAGNGQLWTPGNFDGKFLGPITLRTALQRSRNVVSVYLLQKIGVDRVVKTARRLGITTPIPGNLSISLGSAEVRMFELVRSYGAFATGGYLADPLLVTSVKDRDGKEIYRQTPRQRKVIEEDFAFLMAYMMQGVVDRGTATLLKVLNRPLAGKTGTTNDQMDAWFIGYDPEWVAGAWVGYDVKRTIGKQETGGKAAAPIFLYFMREFLKDEPALPFDIPDGVVPYPIDLPSGRMVSAEDANAFIEYFKAGTEPNANGYESEEQEQVVEDYLGSDEF